MGGQICSICLDPLSEKIGRLVSCRHEYHLNCLREWHNHSHDKKCPICRVPSDKVEDLENKMLIDINEFHSLSQLISMLCGGITSLGLLENEMPPTEMRPPIVLLECGICGAIDTEIDKYCIECYHVYHECCLRNLLCELGERTSDMRCSDCQGRLVNLISSPTRYRHRGRNAVPPSSNGPSLVTQHFYESTRITNTQMTPHVVQGDTNAVSESWKLLSQLQDNQNGETLQNKCRIQLHVRKSLDYYYKGPRKDLTKDQYTEVNKCVSRNLYQMSGNIYQPRRIDYDAEAHKLVMKELRKLGVQT